MDLVFGHGGGAVTRKTSSLNEGGGGCRDLVLIKANGFPTYHFANVVDDHLMKITHVIRANVSGANSKTTRYANKSGKEWLAYTPIHVYLYQVFGWKPPSYAHACLLVKDRKAPLHKRNMDSSLLPYQQQGVDPQALLNFLALLGWSHGSQNDKKYLEELVRDVSSETPLSYKIELIP